MPRPKKQKKEEENKIVLDLESFQKLQEELEYRKNVLRDEIAKEIAEARELGDLSENHPYKEAMEKRDNNERRIDELEALIQNAEVVEKNEKDNIIGIGEKVEIQNLETGQVMVISLVGSEESQSADPLNGLISISSPIGAAVFNSKVGDIVTVKLPTRSVKYKILRLVNQGSNM